MAAKRENDANAYQVNQAQIDEEIAAAFNATVLSTDEQNEWLSWVINQRALKTENGIQAYWEERLIIYLVAERDPFRLAFWEKKQ